MRWTFLLTLILLTSSSLAHAAATLGFVENWPGTTTSSWGGGSAISNPGTGGYGGADDGYLLVTNAIATNFGTNSVGAEYTGDWTAAGITQVRVRLDDVGNPDALEIHFGLGRGVSQTSPNFWQYNVGFIPPHDAWGEYVVDLTSANWTQIHGTGTLANALQDVETIHLRHDLAPFTSSPDPGMGDFGIDHLLLTNGQVGAESSPSAVVLRPVQLAAPAPNPSRGAVELALQSFDGEPVHLQIVDLAGRVVRHAELPGMASARRTWTWDGRDDAGHTVPPGCYRARAWSASGGTSRPLVRVD
jgi:hypothetical protein